MTHFPKILIIHDKVIPKELLVRLNLRVTIDNGENPRSNVSSPCPSVSITALNVMSYAVSGSKPGIVMEAPSSAET